MSFYSIGPLITSLLLLFLGVVVFFKNKHSMLNKIFFLICISGFAWLFLYSIGYGYKDETSAFLLFKIGYSGVVFIPITTFHYTIEFLRIKKLKSFALLNYLIGLICIALIWSSFTLIKGISLFFWGYYPQSGPFHPFFLIYFFGLVSFSFALWFYFFLFRKKLFTLLEILRIKYVLLAFAVYNFASVDFLPNYGIAIYPFGFLPSFIFAAIIG